MTPSISEAIACIAKLDADRINVVAPFPLDEREARALLGDSRVHIQAPAPLPDIQRIEVGARLIETSDDACPMPLADKRGVTVFLGGPAMFSPSALLSGLLSGRWSLICRIGGRFRHCRIYRLILSHWINDVIWRLRRMPESHPVVRIVQRCRNIGILRRLWHGVKIDDGNVTPLPASMGDDGESIFQEIVTALLHEQFKVAKAVPGRILHVNAGLAAGGAERQICLTLVGLKHRGYSDVALLGEYKEAVNDFPPYTEVLETNGIRYDALVKASVPAMLHRLPNHLAAALSQLPPDFLTDILSLAEEFQRQQPQVIQAWQDATSVRVGIAASIAGIPRILLCGQNVSPVSLPTYQPHFRAAYKAILQLPGVVLTNNSRAGAVSYAAWLGIDPDAIPVIYNAIDTSSQPQPVQSNWRENLAIPIGVPVIGGIFRLVPQKQPLLWVQAVAKLSESFPDAYFVIAGEGSMRNEILRCVAALGLSDRFHLLGNVPSVSSLYAIFDVFLLASQAEGVANVLLEAQNAGVPVVCTNVGGNREAVQPGVTAILVDAPQPEAFASALAHVLRDTSWRDRAKMTGPRHIAANFSLNAMIEKTVGLCEIRYVAGD